MPTHQTYGAVAPGLAAPEQPTKDKAPAVDAAQGFEVQGNSDTLHFPFAPASRQALRIIEGERQALAYLERLHAGTASPDELAVLMAYLQGEMLAGACRVISKALGVRHV